MKEWDVIPKETGYVDGKLISETGEIIFDPEMPAMRFRLLIVDITAGHRKN